MTNKPTPAQPAGQSAEPALCSYIECAALGKSSCEDCRDTPHHAGQGAGSEAEDRMPLIEACKPWEHYTGEPPDDGSPLSSVFVAGMVYMERLLAKLLDVTSYEGGDGSEDFDNDATQTLRNILTGAGLWDADENRAVKPAPDSARTGDEGTEKEKRDIAWKQGWNVGHATALAARPAAPEVSQQDQMPRDLGNWEI